MIKELEFVNLFSLNSTKDKFLCIRRSEKDLVYPGMLAMPGGGVEPGESHQDTAYREIVEETGVEIDQFFPEPVLKVRFIWNHLEGDVIFYQVTLQSNNFNPLDSDISEVEYHTAAEFLESVTEHGYPLSEVEKMRRFFIEQGLLN